MVEKNPGEMTRAEQDAFLQEVAGVSVDDVQTAAIDTCERAALVSGQRPLLTLAIIGQAFGYAMGAVESYDPGFAEKELPEFLAKLKETVKSTAERFRLARAQMEPGERAN